MISQILRIFFWACLAHILIYAVLAETPKECLPGTPDYNETLCNETCTKEPHANESYCANFTQTTTSIPKQPQQEAKEAVPLSGIMTSTPSEGLRLELTTPKIKTDDVISSASSLRFTLMGSALASVCFLFAYF